MRDDLYFTYLHDRDASVRIYEVFIEAFKKVDDPPKVRVPKRPARQPELAPA